MEHSTVSPQTQAKGHQTGQKAPQAARKGADASTAGPGSFDIHKLSIGGLTMRCMEQIFRDGKAACVSAKSAVTMDGMRTKMNRTSKRTPARRKPPVWAVVTMVALTTLGTVAVAVAKGSDAPSFTFNLSLQIMATNTAKAPAVGQP